MKGLSLVELMISMTLGLATVAAVGWVYLGTMQTYRTHDAMSRMQEGARHAFEMISKDVRMSGTTGCPFTSHKNDITNYTTTWYANLFELPLSSVEQDAAATGEVNEYSDALRVLRADVSLEGIVSSATASNITLVSDVGFQSGDLLVATDCTHAAVFQATAGGQTVAHATGGTPGNVSGDPGATYTAGSRVYRMNAVTYYIAPNSDDVPSLFRLVPTGASATETAEELVEGVEDLQVTYGVDTTPSRDGVVDLIGGEGYVDADTVNSASVPGANISEKFGRVVSVRVSLLMRTAEDRIAPEPQSYEYNGGSAITADDRRVRKVFTHVIKVRNR